MSPETLKKPSRGGENPYLYAAGQLGVRERFEEQVELYLNGERTEEDYRRLCAWEVGCFNQAFEEKNGRLPRPGDIEKLLPESQATPAALNTLPGLRKVGVEVAVVSSGFNYLVLPNAAKLGIEAELVMANDLSYGTETEGLVEVVVKVSGDKVKAIQKIIGRMTEKGLLPEAIAYVDDNNWGRRGMEYLLNAGGHVFYLGDDASKDEPLAVSDPVRSHPRFHPVASLEEIPTHEVVTQGEVRGIIFDADGTVIDVAEKKA